MKKVIIGALLCIIGLYARVYGGDDSMLMGLGKAKSGAFSPACSSSSAFLARATNVTVTSDKQHYDTLLCTLQTDGIGCGSAQATNLDVLYILGAPDSATALLNLCSSSFALTVTGSPTFTANSGYDNGSNSNFLDTGYVPSSAGGACTLNSCSVFAYDLTERAAGNAVQFGSSNGAFTNTSFVDVFISAGNSEFGVNDASFIDADNSGNHSKGAWMVSRTGATTVTIHRNGSAFGTSTTSSSGLPNASYFILALNQGGSAVAGTTDRIFSAAGGGGLTTTQMDQIANAVNTFATSLGINVY